MPDWALIDLNTLKSLSGHLHRMEGQTGSLAKTSAKLHENVKTQMRTVDRMISGSIDANATPPGAEELDAKEGGHA